MTLMACVQIPHVAIALARRNSATLADAPLILYTTQPRATVYAAAPEVPVAPGLPLRQAMLHAPHVQCRRANPKQDQTVFSGLVALLESFSPRVETGDLLPHATVELDLGRRTLSQAMTLTERMAAAIRSQLQLTPAMGLARHRFVARVAAATAGAGMAVVVPPRYEAMFLAPLPVGLLPLEEETARRLDSFGLRTIGAVAAVPIDALQVQFGAFGRTLHCLANGIDDRPISATVPEPRIEVRRQFEGSLANRHILDLALRALAVELAAALTSGAWAARDVVLTLPLTDGLPWSEQRILTEPTSDHHVLAQVLSGMLAQASLESGVEGMTLQVTDVRPTVTTQLELFAPEHGHAGRLHATLERLTMRYSGRFMRATVVQPEAHVAEQRVQFDSLRP